jgi:hypothetical protein
MSFDDYGHLKCEDSQPLHPSGLLGSHSLRIVGVDFDWLTARSKKKEDGDIKNSRASGFSDFSKGRAFTKNLEQKV